MVAEQYAADGYLVIVPDLFWRNGHRIELTYDEAGWKRAVELMNATDIIKAQADIKLAIDVLDDQPGLDGGIASIGYCFGGCSLTSPPPTGWWMWPSPTTAAASRITWTAPMTLKCRC